MDQHPLDKKTAALLFEGSRPDPAGAVGQDILLAVSATVFIDAGGVPTMRLALNRPGKVETYAIAPYTAARLAHALVDIVNATGQYRATLELVDTDSGAVFSIKPPASSAKN